MAGDWIKIQTATPDKPEVVKIAERLGITPEQAVGCLIRVWVWFDTHTENGNAANVTPATLDRITFMPGFAEAMAATGWLVITDNGITMPNFDYHTGKSAKNRALSARRTARNRDKSNAMSVTGVTAEAPAREEKRREEIPITSSNGGQQDNPRGKRLPKDWILPESWRAFGQQERPDLDIEQTALQFYDHWIAQPGKAGIKVDWFATWRNWVRRQYVQGVSRGTKPATKHQQFCDQLDADILGSSDAIPACEDDGDPRGVVDEQVPRGSGQADR